MNNTACCGHPTFSYPGELHTLQTLVLQSATAPMFTGNHLRYMPRHDTAAPTSRLPARHRPAKDANNDYVILSPGPGILGPRYYQSKGHHRGHKHLKTRTRIQTATPEQAQRVGCVPDREEQYPGYIVSTTQLGEHTSHCCTYKIQRIWMQEKQSSKDLWPTFKHSLR